MSAGNYGGGGAANQPGTQGLIVINYTPAATGGLSGSTSLSFGTSGALAASGNLVGATSLGFALTGGLGSSAFLSGTTSVAFSTSGTINGSGVLAGNTSLAFSLSAANSNTSPLVGPVALSTALTGTLTGKGKLSGATSLAFALAGDTSTPTSAIAGSTALAFGLSGTAAGAGVLSGSIGLGFALYGEISNAAFHSTTSSGIIYAGTGSAAGAVPWGAKPTKQKDTHWMPNATVPVLDKNGNMNRPWYLFFKEVAENRLGGINAESVPQVAVKQNQVNAYLVDVQSGVVNMGAQVAAITDTVNTQTEVAQANALAGATQISKLPSYKQDQLGKSLP